MSSLSLSLSLSLCMYVYVYSTIEIQTRTQYHPHTYVGTYDHAKHMLIPYVGDNFFSHVGASGIAGFASACVSTPADVVKTRLMNQAGNANSERAYAGMIHCLTSVFREEGFFALYKGFVPILVRKLLWTSAFFVTYEQSRKWYNS